MVIGEFEEWTEDDHGACAGDGSGGYDERVYRAPMSQR